MSIVIQTQPKKVKIFNLMGCRLYNFLKPYKLQLQRGAKKVRQLARPSADQEEVCPHMLAIQIIHPRLGFVLLCTPRRGCPLRDCAFPDSYLLKQNVVYQQASPPGYHGACQDISETFKRVGLSQQICF